MGGYQLCFVAEVSLSFLHACVARATTLHATFSFLLWLHVAAVQGGTGNADTRSPWESVGPGMEGGDCMGIGDPVS